MKIKWEKIGTSDNGSGTWRARVIGGWLVNNLTIIETHKDGTQRTATESMVFIPDTQHVWSEE